MGILTPTFKLRPPELKPRLNRAVAHSQRTRRIQIIRDGPLGPAAAAMAVAAQAFSYADSTIQ